MNGHCQKSKFWLSVRKRCRDSWDTNDIATYFGSMHRWPRWKVKRSPLINRLTHMNFYLDHNIPSPKTNLSSLLVHKEKSRTCLQRLCQRNTSALQIDTPIALEWHS
jgi:hypothetical protein